MIRSMSLMACLLPALVVAEPPAQGPEGILALGLPVSGVVQRVMVAPGQTVEAGQALLALDPRPFELRVAATRARAASLLPAREETARELERAQELYDRTVLSDVELQRSRDAATVAAARHEEALAALALAELELEHATLRAPLDGRVEAVRAGAGTVVINRCEARSLVDLRPAPAQGAGLAPAPRSRERDPVPRAAASEVQNP